MRVAIIVITRNRSQYLAAVLQQLSRLDYPDFEIVVVDSSTGEEKE
jgi:glycosyltransferase involved in cell wall biosynthesis